MNKTKSFTVMMLGAALFMLLLAPAALTAQEKMPLTTVSPEAEEQFMEGKNQFLLMHFPEAVDHLTKAVELDPSFAQAHLYLAIAKTGWTGLDTKHLNKAVTLANEVAKGEKHLIHYAKAMNDGDEDKISLYRNNLIEMYPEDEMVRLWAAMYHYASQEYDKVIKHTQKAVDINDSFHAGYNLLGYGYMETGEMQKAEKAFKKYLELIPENANAHDSYAEFLLRNGQFDESIEHYKKALEINPTFTASHKGLADNYLFKGDITMARQHYQKLTKNNSSIADKFNGMLYEASVDLHEDNTGSALATIDKYIMMAEEKDIPYYQIYGNAYKGHILTETGKADEGMKYYQKAIDLVAETDLDPVMKRNMETQAQLWEFYALASNKEMEEAEKVRKKCENTLNEQGNSQHWKTYHQVRGIMDLYRGLYDQARQHLAKAHNTPETWYYTGLTWEKDGQRDKARKWYQKVTNHYQNTIGLGTVRNKAMAGLEK
jgi:tetratricopeptide (TPR) repeat protein